MRYFAFLLAFERSWLTVISHQAGWQQTFLQGDAKCADGSPPVMYVQEGLKDKWLVYFEHGGFCGSGARDEASVVDACLAQMRETPALYTSSLEQRFQPFIPLNLLADGDDNPFKGYSKLYVAYCTQDLWLGTRTLNSSTASLNLHGLRIAKGALTWLNNTHLQATGAVTLYGASAGGFAVLNTLAWARANIQHGELRGIMDSSWMVDLDGVLREKLYLPSNGVPECDNVSYRGVPCCGQVECMAFLQDFPPAGVPFLYMGFVYDPYILKLVAPKDPVTGFRDLERYGERLHQSVDSVAGVWTGTGKSATVFLSDCANHVALQPSSRSFQTLFDCDGQNEVKVGDSTFRIDCEPGTYPHDIVGNVSIDGRAQVMVDTRDARDRLAVGGVTLQTAINRWFRKGQAGGVVMHLEEEFSFQSGWCPTEPLPFEQPPAELWFALQTSAWVSHGLLWASALVFVAVAIADCCYISELSEFLANHDRPDRVVNVLMAAPRKNTLISRVKSASAPPMTISHSQGPPAEAKVPTLQKNVSVRPLQWRSVRYVTANGKELLKGLDGDAHAGRVTAIMGGSGSGKTTLLDMLGMRRTSGKFSGYIGRGAVLKKAEELRSYLFDTGYVKQTGLPMNPGLPVSESLYFATMLRMPGQSLRDRYQRIRDVLEAVGLMARRDVPVIQLSGGQQRRLLVAIELLHLPSVLLLDEPTSGLDSTTTISFMGLVSHIAKALNKIVVLTIHQPPIEAFAKIDELYLMHSGRAVFQGFRDQGVDLVLRGVDCSTNVADCMIARLPEFAEGKPTIRLPKPNITEKHVDTTQPYTSSWLMRVRMYTSVRWRTTSWIEMAVLLLFFPLLVSFGCGYPVLRGDGKIKTLDVMYSASALILIPPVLLASVTGANAYQRTMLPTMYEMQAQWVNGREFLAYWFLVELVLCTVSTSVTLSLAGACYYGTLLSAGEVASLILKGNMLTVAVLCIHLAALTSFSAVSLPKQDEREKESATAFGSTCVMISMFCGTMYGGVIFPFQSLPTVLQAAGLGSPFLWIYNSLLLTLLRGRTLDMPECEDLISSIGGAEEVLCTGDFIVRYLGLDDFHFLPTHSVTFFAGVLIFTLALSWLLLWQKSHRCLQLFKDQMVDSTEIDPEAGEHGKDVPAEGSAQPVPTTQQIQDGQTSPTSAVSQVPTYISFPRILSDRTSDSFSLGHGEFPGRKTSRDFTIGEARSRKTSRDFTVSRLGAISIPPSP